MCTLAGWKGGEGEAPASIGGKQAMEEPTALTLPTRRAVYGRDQCSV